MHPETAAASALRNRGVPVYRTIERAVGVLARLAEAGERVPRGVPGLPEAATAAAAHTYSDARALLAAGGVPFVPAGEASTPDEAATAAAELGYPVVLKALGLLHK